MSETMKIKVLRSIGTDHADAQKLPLYTEGQVVDAEEAVAKKLIKRGLAEEVADDSPAKKAK